MNAREMGIQKELVIKLITNVTVTAVGQKSTQYRIYLTTAIDVNRGYSDVKWGTNEVYVI